MALGEGKGCAYLRIKGRDVTFTNMPLLPLVTSPLALRNAQDHSWLVNKCLRSGLCASCSAGICQKIALRVTENAECGFRFRDARDVLSAPFLKVKSSQSGGS